MSRNVALINAYSLSFVMMARRQCCGSGSARTRNFYQDPELEVMDPNPELDLNLIKKLTKMSILIITGDMKNTLI
jgi:hypothetical protein